MALYGFLLNDNENLHIKPSGNSKPFFEKKMNEGVLGGNFTSQMPNDKFFFEKDGISIAFDGINLTENIKMAEDFIKAFQTSGITFISELKGIFSGFIFDSNNQKLHLFNDHLSTKNIYYYHSKKGFAFASALQTLSHFFKQNKITYNLNHDAVYMMALYGFILDNQTYINEINILPYGSILTYDLKNEQINITSYFDFDNTTKPISYDVAIDIIEKKLTESIAKNWDKNSQYSHSFFTLLSGGMDARVNALIAKELGYKNIHSLTFGQSDSQDIKYAELIAQKEGFKHQTFNLDGGDYLYKDIYNNYIVPTDGMIFYNTISHLKYTLQELDLKPFSVVHSGQIGDLLFGSFSKSGYDIVKNKANIGYTGFVKPAHLLNKIKSLPRILKKYQEKGYEIYAYEERVIHATLFGDKSISHFIDTISPFYDRELIEFCISLPKEYKKNQMIYFDWLKKYHPQVLNYPWDKIQMKPNRKWKIKYGKIFKRYYNGAKKYFHWHYDSMNPYGIWLEKNKQILLELNRIFKEEMEKKLLPDEIKKDLNQIYHDDIFEYRNKFAVITALLAIKLHFEK